MWERFPDEMRSALARHDTIVREAIAGDGGFVFSTVGDSFAAVFQRAIDAVHAALAAQEALGAESFGVDVRVRMGLPTGEAHERDGDYFETAVNRAGTGVAAAR